MNDGSQLQPTMGRITKYSQHGIQLMKRAIASVLYMIIISSGYRLPVIRNSRRRRKGRRVGEKKVRRGGEKSREDTTGEDKFLSGASHAMVSERLLRLKKNFIFSIYQSNNLGALIYQCERYETVISSQFAENEVGLYFLAPWVRWGHVAGPELGVLSGS